MGTGEVVGESEFMTTASDQAVGYIGVAIDGLHATIGVYVFGMGELYKIEQYRKKNRMLKLI